MSSIQNGVCGSSSNEKNIEFQKCDHRFENNQMSAMDENVMSMQSKDHILAEKGGKDEEEMDFENFKLSLHGDRKPNSRSEAAMNMFKGSIGSGALAMGDAFKNGGLLFAILITVVVAGVSCYNQYFLIVLSKKFKNDYKLKDYPDFSDTVGIAFKKYSKFSSYSNLSRKLVTIFMVITQLGFCSVYFLFISRSITQVAAFYGIVLDIRVIMLYILPVILLTSMIRNLKYISPLSTIANITTMAGILTIIYYNTIDLPPLTSRPIIANWKQLPLSISTVAYTFEIISLVIPIHNTIKRKNQFLGPCGVLNFNTYICTALVIVMGFTGYLKHGDKVGGMLTENLDVNLPLARLVISCMAISILLTYTLQFYVPVILMLPSFQKLFKQEHYSHEYILRALLVTVTFLAAELVPHLPLFVSLIGAGASVSLSLILPSLSIIAVNSKSAKYYYFKMLFNFFSLSLGIIVAISGTIFSVKEIVIALKTDFNI